MQHLLMSVWQFPMACMILFCTQQYVSFCFEQNNSQVLNGLDDMNRLYYIYARHCLLILSKNKENVTFTWATGVQDVLCFTIAGDKFGIYVPISRYGDFNTLRQLEHTSAAPQRVLGYFRVLKSPYLRIGTYITYNINHSIPPPDLTILL